MVLRWCADVRLEVEGTESGGLWTGSGGEGRCYNGEKVGGEGDVCRCVSLEVHQGADDIEVKGEAAGAGDEPMRSDVSSVINMIAMPIILDGAQRDLCEGVDQWV